MSKKLKPMEIFRKVRGRRIGVGWYPPHKTGTLASSDSYQIVYAISQSLEDDKHFSECKCMVTVLHYDCMFGLGRTNFDTSKLCDNYLDAEAYIENLRPWAKQQIKILKKSSE